MSGEDKQRRPERTQVIVAGAGPVGCVAAMLLAEAGIETILLEAGPDCAADMRASTFHAPTLEMLDTLGLTQPLIDRGLKAPIFHWRDRRSGEILPFDLTEISDATRYPFRIQCEQYHLSRMITEKLEGQSGVDVRFLNRLVYLEQDEKGVTASVETLNDIQTIRADYLIGADGASSIVRKWLGLEFEGFTYPEKFLCLTTDEPLENALPGLAAVNYVSDPEEWLVLLRVPTLWRVLLPGYDEGNERLLSDQKKDEVFDRLVGHGPAVRTFHRTIYRVHQRVAERFQKGRVFLMGDAAHVNNPLGGFGMNSGIHDAFSLWEKLVPVLKGEADPSTLERYDRQRRAVAHSFVQRQTIQNMELMRAQSENHQQQRQFMRDLAADPQRRRDYMLRQSMITSLREAEAIA